MTRNTITATLITAALLAAYSCGEKDPLTDAKGAADFCTDFTGDGSYTLKNFRNGTDYIINCNIELQSGNIEIEPGTEILIDASKYILIGGNASLKALGNASAPISFLPKEQSSLATWGGIVITSSNPTTSLQHVIIDRAGSEDLKWQASGMDYYPQNQVLGALVSCGKGSFSNVTIRNSGGAGLIIGYNSQASFADIKVENAQYYPLMTEGNRMVALSPVFTFTNNSLNRIGTWLEGYYTELNTDGTWKDLGYPLSLMSNIVITSDNEFGPGLEIDIANDLAISVNGTLKISGTLTNPVILRGSSPIKGWWKGIHYLSVSNLNTIENLVLSDAGSNAFDYVNSHGAVICGDGLGNTGKLNINSSEIKNTEGCGLIEVSGSTLTHTNVTYSNTDSDFCQE